MSTTLHPFDLLWIPAAERRAAAELLRRGFTDVDAQFEQVVADPTAEFAMLVLALAEQVQGLLAERAALEFEELRPPAALLH